MVFCAQRYGARVGCLTAVSQAQLIPLWIATEWQVEFDSRMTVNTNGKLFKHNRTGPFAPRKTKAQSSLRTPKASSGRSVKDFITCVENPFIE